MSANVPISSIIEPPQFSVGKEQRVFMPAQHADGGGEVSAGRSSRQMAWGMPIEERSRSSGSTRITKHWKNGSEICDGAL